MVEHWIKKFRLAFHGVYLGMVGQTSFCIHLPIAAAVLFFAWLLDCTTWQWCLLGLCIGMVLSLELCNSAIELLAKGLCSEHNEQVGRALDIASASVLVASLVAACIGCVIFFSQLGLVLTSALP
jgi:diacylglycerol kinase (ATP)